MDPDERKSCRRHTLKKGPWTSSEDMILVEYVKKHGEGNWNAVQRNSGLMRCGKSCRLRWANHLRPNLKKGAFSADEEKLIVDLHAKLGNKWARMAAQLPGRTDNEIKNYWNTRLKRRQRAGLPIYPQEAVSAATKQEQQLNISTSQSPTTTTNLNCFSYINSPVHDHHHLKLYPANNGGSLSLSNIIIPASFSTGPYFNLQGESPLMSSILHQHNNSVLNYGGYQYQMGFLGLPSIQSSSATTSSITDGADQDYHDQVEVEPTAAGFSSQRSKSGLLEDLLGESQALGCHQEPEDQDVDVPGNVHQKAFGNLIGNGNSKSDDNDYEGQENKGPREGMTNFMDEDLLNLLDNFPLSVPIPDWNNDQGKGIESPLILTDGTTSVTESQHNTLQYNPVASSTGAANQDWNFGSCPWNNMPSIY